jgi:hypothetical protein
VGVLADAEGVGVVGDFVGAGGVGERMELAELLLRSILVLLLFDGISRG